MTTDDQLDDASTRLAMESALRLQRLFTCMAETKAARALHNYAGSQIALCELREKIASAQSRGRLTPNFYSQLAEWTK